METSSFAGTPYSMTNGSFNASGKGYPSSFFYLPYDAPLIALSFLIVCINSLVIYMFFTRVSLQTKTNSLLVSLAISDSLNGLCSIPLTIFCNLFLNENLCYTTAVFYRFISISTMYHICVVTLERYIYVLYPMKYIHIVTAPRLLKLILSVWLFSILAAGMQTIWNSPDEYFADEQINPTRFKLNLAYNSFCAVFCFLIPLIIMIVSYTRMMLVIHRQIKGIYAHNCPRGRSSGGTQQKSPAATEARAIVIFASMLTIFTVAWSSWYVASLQAWLDDKVPISTTVQDVFEFLRFSVSLLNPFLYTFLKRDFSRALLSLLKRGPLPVSDSDSSATRSTQRIRLQVAYKSRNSRSSRTSTSFLDHGDVSNNICTNGSTISRDTVPETAAINSPQT